MKLMFDIFRVAVNGRIVWCESKKSLHEAEARVERLARGNYYIQERGTGQVFSPPFDGDRLRTSNPGTPQAWRELYKMAILEREPAKLRVLIQDTESAIFLRLQHLSGNPEGDTEIREILNSAADLLVLKNERLGWPRF